jgi:hypothetical protein
MRGPEEEYIWLWGVSGSAVALDMLG